LFESRLYLLARVWQVAAQGNGWGYIPVSMFINYSLALGCFGGSILSGYGQSRIILHLRTAGRGVEPVPCPRIQIYVKVDASGRFG
jgi:hypothetical protein